MAFSVNKSVLFTIILILLNLNKILLISKFDYVLTTPQDCINQGDQNGYQTFFDVTQLSCKPCSQTSDVQITSDDGLRCVCKPGTKYTKDLGRDITCVKCNPGMFTSKNKWECVSCIPTGRPPNTNNTGCPECLDTNTNIAIERMMDGNYPSGKLDSSTCIKCGDRTRPNYERNGCELCTQVLGINGIFNCFCKPENMLDGMCYSSIEDINNVPDSQLLSKFLYVNNQVESAYFNVHARTAIAQCGKNYRNISACEQLANLCVSTMYNKYQRGVCDSYISIIKINTADLDRPINMSWLYYSDLPNSVLKDTSISKSFDFPSSNLKIVLSVRHLNGTYMGLWSADEGHLQLCPSTYKTRVSAYTFGTNFKQRCQLKVDDLYDTVKYPTLYFDPFLQYADNQQTFLYAIPVVTINMQPWKDDYSKKNDDRSTWQLTRRFLMVDNTIGMMQDASEHYVQYAQSLKIFVSLQKDTISGNILPPYLEVSYAAVRRVDMGKTVEVSFSVSYDMDLTRHERDMWISFGVMVIIGFILSIIDTWSWSSRSGQIGINCLTLVQWFFIMSGHLANALFIVLLGSSLWTLIFYKNQRLVTFLVHDGLHNEQFLSYLICACLLKLLQLIHLIITQINVDIFLVDWEKPTRIETNVATSTINTLKGTSSSSAAIGGIGGGGGGGNVSSGNSNRLQQLQQYQLQQQQMMTPSVWRMYLVANEWNEIQSFRKINPMVQFILVVFFLEIIGFGYLSTMDPVNEFKNSDYNANVGNGDDVTIVHSHLLRFAWICIVYITVGICQLVFVLTVYERFFEDKIRQFVDLCSTCNMSMFIFATDLYGYYIHGRSVHGRSDVGLRQMHENFAREEKDVVSKRGLLSDDEEQTFEIIVSRKLRNNIDKITKPVLYSQNTRNQKAGFGKEFEQSIEAHYVMNQTLMAYIDHTLTDVDYIVKKKSLLEALLNIEFQTQSFLGTFYKDNGHSFDSVLFYGHEATLMIFEVLMMSCMDLIFTNYVLDAMITYVLMEMVMKLVRESFGRSNLARKTMVDKRFLI